MNRACLAITLFTATVPVLAPAQAAAQAPHVACARPVPAQAPGEEPAEMHHITRGEDVRVAVIDTGVADHPHLAVEAVADLVTPGSPDPHLDCDGHGTVVAGVIARVAPGALILSVRQSSAHYRQVDGGAAGTLESLATAIHRALDAGAQVINTSVVSCLDSGTLLDVGPLHAALHRAEAEGAVVIAAAGNVSSSCRPGMTVFPAHEDTVLPVAAVHPGDPHAVADYVMPGAGHISAPGLVEVGLSPAGHGWASGVVNAQGQETRFEGTSFAAPVVSGVAALLRQRHPQESAAQIRARIRQAAEPGHGVVDPLTAITHLAGDYGVEGRGHVVEKQETPAPRAPARAAQILGGLGVVLLIGLLSGGLRAAVRKG